MKFHFLRKNKKKTWKGNYSRFYSHLLRREFEPDMQNKYNTNITPAQMKVKSCVTVVSPCSRNTIVSSIVQFQLSFPEFILKWFNSFSRIYRTEPQCLVASIFLLFRSDFNALYPNSFYNLNVIIVIFLQNPACCETYRNTVLTMFESNRHLWGNIASYKLILCK